MESDLQLLTLTERMSTADNSNPPLVPLPDVDWQELLDRYAIAAFQHVPEYGLEEGVKWWDACGEEVEKWQDLLKPPATTEEIAEASRELIGLPDDFKQMVAIHNGFLGPEQGSWYVGGCAGLYCASMEDSEALQAMLDIPPNRITYDMDDPNLPPNLKNDVDQQGPQAHWYENNDTSNNPVERGHIIELCPLIGMGEGGIQYIIPHETWKKYGNPDAKPGEYRYVHAGDDITEWPSYRRYMGEIVVDLEAKVEAQRAANSDEEDTSDAEE